MKCAISYLHGLGFVHSDVKPDNIFLGAGGVFLLGDFGSLVKFGNFIHSTTPVFIPSDADTHVASPALDWWMLAMFIAEEWSGKSRAFEEWCARHDLDEAEDQVGNRQNSFLEGAQRSRPLKSKVSHQVCYHCRGH